MNWSKNILLALLLALPSAGMAFSVTNHTDYTVNINISNEQWWFSYTYTIAPHTEQCEYSTSLETDNNSYYTIKIKSADSEHKINDTWKVYANNDVKLAFEKSASGQLQIFANQARIW